MVNQDIVSYLEEGVKRGFSIPLLKQKLAEGGFSEIEIDEAIAHANKTTQKPPVSQPTELKPTAPLPQEEPSVQIKEKPVESTEINTVASTGIRWLKIGSMGGFALFLIILTLIIFSLFSDLVPINPLELAIGSGDSGSITQAPEISAFFIVFFFIFMVLIVVASFLFLFSSNKMGKHFKSKLLPVSSWGLVILGTVFVVVYSIFEFYIYRLLKDPAAVLVNFSAAQENILLMMKIISPVLLVGSIFLLLFSVALLKAEQIRLSLFGGLAFLVLGIFALLKSVLYTLALFSSSFGESGFASSLLNFLFHSMTTTVMNFIALAGILLVSLTLLKASTMFER